MRNIDFLSQKPIAHRGVHNLQYPENSLGAFLRATVRDFPIELDVQLTSDGELVVFHDWKLDRMTSTSGKVNKKNYKELEQIFLQNSKEKIPLLKDVFQLVDGRVPIIIEIKQRGINISQICSKIYKELDNYSGSVAISSFNPFIVRWWKRNASDVVRGQNFTNFQNNSSAVAWVKRIFLYTTWLISSNNPDFFAIRAQMIPNSFSVRRALKNKKPILVYAIKDYGEYARIKDVVDNEFFDIKPYKNK